jgi:hypothetical protein
MLAMLRARSWKTDRYRSNDSDFVSSSGDNSASVGVTLGPRAVSGDDSVSACLTLVVEL